MATIHIDPLTQAFYQGAAAADAIQKTVEAEASTNMTSDMKLAAFWVGVGRAVAQLESEPEAAMFMRGVTATAPQRRGVWVEFDTTGRDFHMQDAEDESYDYEQDDRDFRARVSAVLQQVRIDVVNGSDAGDVRDHQNRVIGRWVIND